MNFVNAIAWTVFWALSFLVFPIGKPSFKIIAPYYSGVWEGTATGCITKERKPANRT